MVRKASVSALAALVTAAYCFDSAASAESLVVAPAARTKKKTLAATSRSATAMRTTLTRRHEVGSGPVAVVGSLTRGHRAGQHPLPRVVTEHGVQSSPASDHQRAPVAGVHLPRAGIVRGDPVAAADRAGRAGRRGLAEPAHLQGRAGLALCRVDRAVGLVQGVTPLRRRLVSLRAGGDVVVALQGDVAG